MGPNDPLPVWDDTAVIAKGWRNGVSKNREDGAAGRRGRWRLGTPGMTWIAAATGDGRTLMRGTRVDGDNSTYFCCLTPLDAGSYSWSTAQWELAMAKTLKWLRIQFHWAGCCQGVELHDHCCDAAWKGPMQWPHATLQRDLVGAPMEQFNIQHRVNILGLFQFQRLGTALF